jgi:putative alpha-1,2-mannosidase
MGGIDPPRGIDSLFGCSHGNANPAVRMPFPVTTSHDKESAKPWRCAVEPELYGFTAEVAPTTRVAIFRFAFPASGQAHLLIATGTGPSIDQGGKRVTGITCSCRPAGSYYPSALRAKAYAPSATAWLVPSFEMPTPIRLSGS